MPSTDPLVADLDATLVAEAGTAQMPADTGMPISDSHPSLEDEPVDPATVQEPTPKQPRPYIEPGVRQRNQEEWEDTQNVPSYAEAEHAYNQCAKVLFPWRFDLNDPYRGKLRQELKDGKEKRRVNTPIIWRNLAQMTSMTIPEEHRVEYQPKKRMQPQRELPNPNKVVPTLGRIANDMPPPIMQELGPEPHVKLFADSLSIVVPELLEEVNHQEILEAFVRDSGSFPLAVLKVTWQSDMMSDPLSSTQNRPDQQDNEQKLRVLMDSFAAGEFTDSDARYVEMAEIMEALGSTTELKRWYGYSVENRPMTAIRISPRCRSFDKIYRAPWISDDVVMTRGQFKARYPYLILEQDEAGNVVKWSGVHPLDADAIPAAISTTLEQNSNLDRAEPRNSRLNGGNPSRGGVGSAAGLGNGMGNGQPAKNKDDDLIVLREKWDLEAQHVKVMCEGLEYPVDVWVPAKPTTQWYPFVFCELNPVHDDPYGIADTELQAPLQDRINYKRNLEEKAMDLGLPRGLFNTTATDGQEVVKIQDIEPGHLRGVNVGSGQKMSDAVEWMSVPFNPQSYDTTKDEQDMRRMAALPEQATGVTGNADFAAEVQVAARGASINTRSRQNRVRRSIVRFYQVCGELAWRNMTPQQARDVGGPGIVWPLVSSELEAAKIMDDIKNRARQITMPQMMMQLQPEMLMGVQHSPQEMNERLEKAMQPFIQQEIIQRFGFPTIVTGERMWRDMQVKVKIGFDGLVDRDQRITAINLMFQALANAANAARSAGIPFDPKPLVEVLSKLVGEDHNLDQMFPPITPEWLAQQSGMMGGENGTNGPPKDGEKKGEKPGASRAQASGPGGPGMDGGPAGGNG
jgi:hypothetical protein